MYVNRHKTYTAQQLISHIRGRKGRRCVGIVFVCLASLLCCSISVYLVLCFEHETHNHAVDGSNTVRKVRDNVVNHQPDLRTIHHRSCTDGSVLLRGVRNNPDRAVCVCFISKLADLPKCPPSVGGYLNIFTD